LNKKHIAYQNIEGIAKKRVNVRQKFDVKEGRKKGKETLLVLCESELVCGWCLAAARTQLWVSHGCDEMRWQHVLCGGSASAAVTITMKCGAQSFQLQPLSDHLLSHRCRICL